MWQRCRQAEWQCAAEGDAEGLAASATALAAMLLLHYPADGNAQGPTTGHERKQDVALSTMALMNDPKT